MTVLKEQPPRLLRGIPLASNGLRKTFGQREVLKGIDLHIPAGQFVAIVGRSGCGKSTLLRLLAGLDQPTAGQLLAGAAPLEEAREETRLMFQDARLLPWKKVIDNVGLGLSGDWRPRALEALDAVGLADRANEWPAALSGGQKQRVALACLATGDPVRWKRWRRLAWRTAPMNGRQPSRVARSSAWPWRGR